MKSFLNETLNVDTAASPIRNVLSEMQIIACLYKPYVVNYQTVQCAPFYDRD